jgi:tetratricopeptide (TPR) repeat protein
LGFVPWARFGEALLGGLLLLSVGALGGVPDWTVLPLAGLAALALLAALVAARAEGRDVRFPALAAVPLAIAAVSLVQLIPLPMAVLRHASPFLYELNSFALEPLGLGRSRPLSLDPARTWLEVSKALTAFLVLGAAHTLGRDRTARRRLFIMVAVLGALTAAVGLLHLLVGWDSLFGVWRFHEAAPPLITPFGNPNHLAGFLVLGVTLLLSLALRPEENGRRLFWALGYVLTGTGIFLSLSRGGLLAFLVTQVLFGVALWRIRRQGGAPLRRLTAAALLLMLTVAAVGTYAASESLWAELFPAASSPRSKLESWPELSRAAAAFPLGMGRGAFLYGFNHFQTSLGNVAFTHAENAPLQLASELGWGIGGAVCLLALWLGVRAVLQRIGTPLELAALSGLVGLVLQNLFDFSLEYPACALAASVLAGAAVASGRGRRREPERPADMRARFTPEPFRRPGGAVSVTAIVAIVGSLGAALHGPTQAEADEEALKALPINAALTRAAALPRIDRHPADPWLFSDPWLFLTVARAYVVDPRADPAQALAWINRALWLRPADAEAHLWAARALMRLGMRVQAMEEYRAYYLRGGDATVVAGEAISKAHGGIEVRALLPPDGQALYLLSYLANNGRGEEALAALEEMGEELLSMQDGWALAVLKARLLRERGRLREAQTWLERAEALVPGASLVVTERARLLAATGRGETARTLLRRHLAARPSDAEVAVELAKQLMAAKDLEGARRTARDALPHAPSALDRVNLLLVESHVLTQQGLKHRAAESLEAAVTQAPQLPWLHYELAKAFEEAGRYEDAAAQVRAGVKVSGPGADPQRAWLAQLARQSDDSLRKIEESLLAAPDAGTGGPSRSSDGTAQ